MTRLGQDVVLTVHAAPPRWSVRLHGADGAPLLAAEEIEPGESLDRLELRALAVGLEALGEPVRLNIRGVERHLREGLLYGLPEWHASDWRWDHFSATAPVRHLDLWRRIDRALKYHELAEVSVKLPEQPPARRRSARPAALLAPLHWLGAATLWLCDTVGSLAWLVLFGARRARTPFPHAGG